MTQDAHTTTHIEMQAVSKQFGGVVAVRSVDLTIARGTVHALVGENGAGKSTVSKMIAGVLAPSSGRILLSGEAVRFGSPRQALAAGVAMVDQELALVPHLSVMDNIFLGFESGRAGFLKEGSHRARMEELIEQTGFDLPRDTPVGRLRMADRQKVEILRAIARDADLIIMDEPTAALTQVEADQLHDVIRWLRGRGTTIVYISHFLDAVLQVADVVTVMRDGRHISTRPANEETEQSLVRAMLGRSLDLAFPEHEPYDAKVDPILEVRALSARGRFADIDLTLCPGEILGIAGLIGSGRTELLRAIYGADPFDDGEILFQGTKLSRASPRRSLSRGIALLPESRADDGLMMVRPVAENMMISNLRSISSCGFVQPRKQRLAVEKPMRDLDVRASGPSAPMWSLSGGNQQKTLFAKCLMAHPRVMLIDEPTRGVDVGAKLGIYELIESLAANGMALIVVSSDLEEVLGLAHRVLVMRLGRIVAEMPASAATAEGVLGAAFGTAGEPDGTEDGRLGAAPGP